MKRYGNIVTISLIIASFISGYQFEKITNNKKDSFQIIRSFSKNTLTNPLLDCEIYEASSITRTNTMKKNVNDYIETQKTDLNEISIYFRDLNNGPSFGINERNKFAPASLLKVPLMIAYLKQSEKDPNIMTKKVKYQGDHILDKNLPEDESLTPGISYTVDNLIYRMIALSDNLAFEYLLKNIDSESVKAVHKDLDLIYPDNSTPEDYISVKSYASLFRILYNTTYLNKETSEKALEYLKNTDFHLGIQAGIPKNITSALKFGIRETDEYGLKQLHDCGIIFDPKKPYLLCIMTKGNNNEKLTEIIKNVSKIISELL